MVAPIAAAMIGGGLLLLDSLREKKKSDQVKAALRRQFRTEFGSEAQQTPLGPGLQGPVGAPSPSLLSLPQFQSAQTLLEIAPAAALDQARSVNAQVKGEAELAESQRIASADLVTRQDNALLARERLDLDITAATLEQNVTKTEKLERAAANLDVDFAQQLAIKNSEEVYTLAGAGQRGTAPVRGTPLFKEALVGLQKSVEVSEQIIELQELIVLAGSTGNPELLSTGRGKALTALLTGAFKGPEFLNLGVLAGPDLGIIRGPIPDNFSLATQLASNPEATLQGLTTASSIADDNTRVARNAVEGWAGEASLNEFRARADATLVRGEFTRERADRMLTDELVNRAASREAVERIGTFTFDENLALATGGALGGGDFGLGQRDPRQAALDLMRVQGANPNLIFGQGASDFGSQVFGNVVGGDAGLSGGAVGSLLTFLLLRGRGGK